MNFELIMNYAIMNFISCSSINPCLMFRPMSHKSAADNYKLILTTDSLVTPDYPVMIPSIIKMYPTCNGNLINE